MIDVFESGQALGPEEAARRVLAATGSLPTAEQQQAMTKRAIIVRVLHNLIGVARRDGDSRGMLRYLDALLAIAPEAQQERWARAVIRWQAGQREGAQQDADWLLAHQAEDVDLDRVRDFRAVLDRAMK